MNLRISGVNSFFFRRDTARRNISIELNTLSCPHTVFREVLCTKHLKTPLTAFVLESTTCFFPSGTQFGLYLHD